MFETGRDNGFLIRQLASRIKPRATSFMFDFYDRMPFGSDLIYSAGFRTQYRL